MLLHSFPAGRKRRGRGTRNCWTLPKSTCRLPPLPRRQTGVAPLLQSHPLMKSTMSAAGTGSGRRAQGKRPRPAARRGGARGRQAAARSTSASRRSRTWTRSWPRSSRQRRPRGHGRVDSGKHRGCRPRPGQTGRLWARLRSGHPILTPKETCRIWHTWWV